MKQRKNYVSWTAKEEAKVRTTADTLLELNPTLSLLRAVRLSQEELLPERRRMNLSQLNRVPFYLREYLERKYPNRPVFRNALDNRNEHLVWPEGFVRSTSKPEPEPEPEPAPALVAASSPPPSPSPAFLLPVAEAQLLTLLADDNVRAALTLLTEAIEAKLRAVASPTIVEDVTSEGIIDSKARLPTVLIAGLEPKQIRSLTAALENLPPFRFTLTFWVKDESRDRLRDLCRKATKVIVITKFVSHSVFDTIKTLVPRNDIVYCNGSVSALIDPILPALTKTFESCDSSSPSRPTTGNSLSV